VKLCLLLALLMPAVGSAQKLVFLVRHAERADGGAGAANADPLLSKKGEARAKRLAAMLGDAGITAIYASEYRRTQDTAKPLASRLGVVVQAVVKQDTAKLVERLRSQHASEVVLIVGHSNSVPGILKALGGPDVTIGDQEYDSLLVFVPATRALTRLRF